MGSFVDYRGLEVRSPDPVGDGGLILNTNFKELADRAGPVYSTTSDPDANDDSADTNGNGKFYVWSKWLNTSTGTIFVCRDATATAAVWSPATVTLGTDGKIIIDGTQVLYLPDQSDFLGTVVYGDGCANLSTSAPPDGRYNIGIGIGVFDALTEGDSNKAFGYQALEDITTGSRNLGFGYRALRNLIDGDNNVAVGDECLLDITTGDENTCVGNLAGENILGNNNICIGFQAGDNITTGSNNIIIGYDLDADSATADYQLNIGDIIKGDINANEVYFTGEVWQHSPTSGGGLRNMMSEAVGTATAAQTFVIEINVPSGARVNAVQLRVDVALTSGDGGVSWEAELDGGVAHTLGGGYNFAKDTQVMIMLDGSTATVIANAEVDITVTCDSAKNFQAGGKVRAICYYQDLVPMAAAP